MSWSFSYENIMFLFIILFLHSSSENAYHELAVEP